MMALMSTSVFAALMAACTAARSPSLSSRSETSPAAPPAALPKSASLVLSRPVACWYCSRLICPPWKVLSNAPRKPSSWAVVLAVSINSSAPAMSVMACEPSMAACTMAARISSLLTMPASAACCQASLACPAAAACAAAACSLLRTM
ncbi:hypothetical protein D3C78_1563770 [compost metagenome]